MREDETATTTVRLPRSEVVGKCYAKQHSTARQIESCVFPRDDDIQEPSAKRSFFILNSASDLCSSP